jgi:hypothetical protein
VDEDEEEGGFDMDGLGGGMGELRWFTSSVIYYVIKHIVMKLYLY